MKGFIKPEIYYLLIKGYKPKELIAVGCSKSTVYNYSAKLPTVMIRLRVLEKKLKEMKKQEGRLK